MIRRFFGCIAVLFISVSSVMGGEGILRFVESGGSSPSESDYNQSSIVNVVQWSAASGGNDHYYAVLVNDLFWTEADSSASAIMHGNRNGYLVSITSPEENDFVLGVVLDSIGSQPAALDQFWLGGIWFDSAWQWTTGEAWAYTNWAVGEPNNVGIETVVAMWGPGNSDPGRIPGTWNNSTPENSLARQWSVIEWDQPLSLPPQLSCPADTAVYWGDVYVGWAVASDPDTAQNITYSLGNVSPVNASINSASGQVIWPTQAIDICQHSIVVIATNDYELADTCSFEICVTNDPPTAISVDDTVDVLWGQTASGTVVGLDPGGGPMPILYYLVSFDGPGTVDVDLQTGQWQWTTLESKEYLGGFQLGISAVDNSPICSPCSPSNADTCLIDISVRRTARVMIETTEDTPQGRFEYVSISLEDSAMAYGAFSFLIAYDAAALTTVQIVPGQFYDQCQWEYFTYRTGVATSCENNCPTGMVRIVAIAEIRNGNVHPSCFGPSDGVPHELVRLRFLITNDYTYECEHIPIRFFWDDCGDNVLSSVLGDLLYIDRKIYNFDTTLIWDEDNDVLYPEYSRPLFTGAQDACVQNNPDKPVALRYVDFINGGVDIICVDSIDDHGDVNLNGISHEVADAVLFTNYFIFGLSVFQVNVDAQIAATDINLDGIYLTVADLVGLVRITIGDLLPWQKPAPVNVVFVHADDGVVSVGDGVAVGAAHLIVGGLAIPELMADNMDMIYYFDGSVTRILVYSLEGNSFSGEVLRVDGDISSIELAGETGAQLVCNIIPDKFRLNQNYPNPFNPSTNISFYLPTASDYRLTVYNVAGQRVAVFSDYADAGRVEVAWDASEVSSGVYIYRLEAGSHSATRKMVLLK